MTKPACSVWRSRQVLGVLVAALLAAQTGCLVLSVSSSHTKPSSLATPTPSSSVIIPARYEEKLPEPHKDLQPATLPMPRERTSSGLTLDQAINATLLNDPKIRAGMESITQAQGDALTASLAPNPVLNTSQTLMPLGRPFTVDRQGGPPQLDVAVGYPIDWCLFGKRAAAMVSANFAVKVSEADFADLIRTRVRDASQEFYYVLEAQALRDLAKNDLDTKEKTEEIIRRARAAGGRTEIDLDRIRLEVLAAQQTLREAESSLASALARLRGLIGRRDFDPDFTVAGDLGDAPAEEAPSLQEAVALAQQNRPDIHSTQWKISQADADTRVEDKKACPEVTTHLGYTHQFQEKAIGFPDANAWGVGVDVSLPFCNRNQGNRLKARSMATQRRHQLEGDLVDLRSEIEQIVVEYQTARRNAHALTGEQIALARTVRDRINEAFRLGSRTLLEVLDAQRTYRETVRASINSRAAAWRALYKLRSATGYQVSNHERILPAPGGK